MIASHSCRRFVGCTWRMKNLFHHISRMLRVCLPLNDNVLIVDPDQSFSILCFFQPSPVVWYNQATKQVAGLPLCPRKQNTEFGGMFSAKRRHHNITERHSSTLITLWNMSGESELNMFPPRLRGKLRNTNTSRQH